jgi:hypothetical protein
MTETTEQRIEGVARALCVATGNGDPDRLLAWAKPAWSEWVDEARAADAISFAAGWDAAMRPDDAQIEAMLTPMILTAHASGSKGDDLIRDMAWQARKALFQWLAAHRPGETT